MTEPVKELVKGNHWNEEIDLETRIYLGNVDYSSTQEELEKHFSDFEITKVDIPKKKNFRGFSFPLGFAFINLAKKEDIEKFIEKYNETTFKDRVISVRKADPPSEKKEVVKPKKANKKGSVGKKAKKENKADAAAGAATTSVKDAGDDKKTETQTTTETGTEKEDKEEKKVEKKEGETEKEQVKEKAKGTTPGAKKNGTAAKKGRKPFVKKQRVPLSAGTPSKTTVYITNIDFRLTSDDLMNYLKNETSYNPTWVHAPTKGLPTYLYVTLKKRNVEIHHRSKGFAFVKFATEEEQQRFIKEFDGKKINDRAVSCKVAIDVPSIEEYSGKKEVKEDGEVAAEQKEGEVKEVKEELKEEVKEESKEEVKAEVKEEAKKEVKEEVKEATEETK